MIHKFTNCAVFQRPITENVDHHFEACFRLRHVNEQIEKRSTYKSTTELIEIFLGSEKLTKFDELENEIMISVSIGN